MARDKGDPNFGSIELRHCMFGTDFRNFKKFGKQMFGPKLCSARKVNMGTNK